MFEYDLTGKQVVLVLDQEALSHAALNFISRSLSNIEIIAMLRKTALVLNATAAHRLLVSFYSGSI